MSHQSTMFRVPQKPLDGRNSGLSVGSDYDLPGSTAMTGGFKRRKIFINGLLVGLALLAWEVDAEGVKVDDLSAVLSSPRLESFELLPEEHFDRVGNSIEFIKPVPGDRFLVAVPQPKPEGYHRPEERDKGGVGVEQQDKLTPDDTHKFWRLLLTQLSAFAVVFPAGVYLSMRANIRRDWREHIPKGRLPKVPTLAMMSILCVSRRVKSRRWRLWEQREWFRDMRVRHGLESAYRDTGHWKKLVENRWSS